MKASDERFFPLTLLLFSVGYVSYAVGQLLFLVAVAPLTLVLWPFPKVKDWVLQKCTRGFLLFFARFYLPALGLYRVVEILGKPEVPPGRPTVFVANHRGFMDSLLLLGLLPRTGILVKSRYARNPVYALLVRHFDFVSVDPGDHRSVQASIAECRRLLSEGRNLLIYPEGSRARSGRLGRFKNLAFQLAVEAQALLVPVVIHSTRPFMAQLPGSFFPRGPNAFRIRFLDPVPVGSEDTPSTLSDRAYRGMAAELQALDRGTVWDTRPRD